MDKKTITVLMICVAAIAITAVAFFTRLEDNACIQKEAQLEYSVVPQKETVFINNNLGFQLTMPKEWGGHAAYLDYNGCMGNCTAVNILLPTKEAGGGHEMQVGDKKYFSMMKINAWAVPKFEEVSNSQECKEGPCPSITGVIGRNENYVFTLDGSQDAPNDLQGEVYEVGLNFPENFNKYFKFELIPVEHR